MRQPTPPAMPGLPVLGNLLAFNRDRYGVFQGRVAPAPDFGLVQEAQDPR
jgi:hypothetical protein